ncbi:pentapeptide repeat-containing protein [Microcoleus sp. OTE_8_concoct_300]|uniref:pentapeptide repeat-containing protein n=1 Tax=Microcoleus sp. OTE_8_concoct_300 TaxID=2964710 RepID=UPI00403EFF69
MTKTPRKFPGKDLRNHNFKIENDLDLVEADFSFANLQGTDLSDLTLHRANFSHAKLAGANFSHAKLAGAKFCGANLRGANFTNASTDAEVRQGVDFSESQIQGADFSGSTLYNANFTKANAEITQKFLIKFLTLVALVVSGFTASIASTFFFYLFIASPKKSSLPGNKPSFLNSFIVFCLSVFLMAIIRIFINNVFRTEWIIYHVRFGVGLIFVLLALALVRRSDSEANFSSLLIIAIAALSPLLAPQILPFKEFEASLKNTFLANYIQGLGTNTNGVVVSGIFGAVIGSYLGCWFSRLAICKDQRFEWLNFDWMWRLYIKFVSIRGTSFNKADLTGVNFSSANLKGTSFKEAKLNKVCWHYSQYLDCVNIDKDNYLNYPFMRYLLVRKQLQNGSDFDGLNLKGINLRGANLQEASFIGANLSEADLGYANLTYSKLNKASLDGANLAGATLTGACIQSWFIDERTNLNDVICEFIYLKYQVNYLKKFEIERLPDKADGDFAPGEFETLFSKDSETIQLLVRGSGSRQALTAAFQELAEDTSIDYTFQGFEVIGNNALVKIRVSQGTNKHTIRNRFYQKLKQSAQATQQVSEFQGDGNQSLQEFVPTLILTLEEIKERVGKGRIQVDSYNVFESVTAHSFIQGDSINTDDNS